MKKIISICLLLLVMIVIIMSFIHGTNLLSIDLFGNTQQTGVPKAVNIIQDGYNLESSVDINSPNESNAGNADNEFIYTDNMEYRINKIRLTKSIENMDKTKIDYWTEATDDTGNLIDDNTYLFINITIKNLSESPREYTINSISVYGATDNGTLMENYGMRIFNQGIDKNSRDFCHYTFDGQEQTDFDVGTIINDKDIDEYKLLLIINNNGTFPFDDAVKIIPINSDNK